MCGGQYSVSRVDIEIGKVGAAGAECNPGACYNYIGIEEQEVEQLAGTKEGCDDDVEWIMVKRPLEKEAPTADWKSWLGQVRTPGWGLHGDSVSSFKLHGKHDYLCIHKTRRSGLCKTSNGFQHERQCTEPLGRALQARKVDVAPSPSTEWVKKPMGTIRASLGYMSTFEDVDALVNFVKRKYSNRR